MGAAFDRVIAALDAAGSKPCAYSGGQVTAHCPGPGHWRGDIHPSLRVGWGKECALVWCQAGCSTEDVLAAIGLTMAGLFDEPRQRPERPGRKQLWHAIGRARGLDAADRWLYGWLIWPMNWDGSGVPLKFQPKGQRDLAAACGLGRMTIQQATAHLMSHGWLSLACAAPDCKRDMPHAGRGHRAVYGFPGIGTDCPGKGCRFRYRPEKAAQRSHLKVVSIAAIGLLSVAGTGSPPPPTTCLQPKPASDLRIYAPSAAIYHPGLQPFRSTP